MKKLTLTFSGDSVQKFDEFLKFKFGEAAGYLSRDEVDRKEKGKQVEFHIVTDPDSHYRLGYDWALWQFPPNQKKD